MLGMATTVKEMAQASAPAEIEIRRDAVTPVRSILAALTSREDWASLRRICNGRGWTLRRASTFLNTQAALQTASFAVVICSSQLADGYCWRAVLTQIQRMPAPPQLIVADRLADEALWAEVLNLGCYDLLTTPFSEEEVLRVVPMAWDFWQRRFAAEGCGPKPPKPAKPQRPPFVRASGAGAD
jgi:PleD family two-component response regulator